MLAGLLPPTSWNEAVVGSPRASGVHLKLRINHVMAVSIVLVTCLAVPAHAADRMHAGQWVGTTIIGGKTFPTSSCITQMDADAMNGDANAVAAYLQTIIPPEVCRITDVSAEGNKIVYTATCVGAAPKVVTTSYHGITSEGTDTSGVKTTARLAGPCK
jgi:hypothetical protein